MNFIKRLITIQLLWCSMSLIAHAFPAVEEWNTDEGARVLYLHLPEIPMLDIKIAINAGSFHEKKQYGLASMTANLLTKGTKDLDEEELMLALEDLGTSIGMGASTSQSILSYRSLSDDASIKNSLTLLLDILETPRLDKKVFERERTQLIDAQKARLDNISAIAEELYYEKLYPNQYLGTTSLMLQESLATLSLDDVKNFRKRYYHANGANIILVGDIERATAENISSKISKALGKGVESEPIAETPIASKAETFTKFFDSPQTTIIMGHPSINRFSKDYFTLILGNHVLGGSGLTSQLMINIREKQGLTYGIYSGFSPSTLHGPFTISLSTKNENVDHALSETKKLVAEFIKHGPDDDALQRAKNNLVGSMALDLNSNAKLAGALLTIATYDLPLNYYETYPEEIKKVTKEMIQKAFAKHIDLNAMITIIVGGDQ